MKTALNSPNSANSRRSAGNFPFQCFSFSEFQLYPASPFPPQPPFPRPPVRPNGCFRSLPQKQIPSSNLSLDDIHHERRILHVRLGKGRKDRYVPIGTRALRWLDRYLAEVRPLLVLRHAEQALFVTSYGEGFSADVLGRSVAKYIRRADIGRTGGTHLLRHTCAGHLHEAGADIRHIQQLLGHEHLDTTAIYTQVGIKALQDVHARFHPAEQPRRTPGTDPEVDPDVDPDAEA